MEENNQKTSDRAFYLFAIRIVGDFGATIAVPVVVLALLGQHFDEKYHTGPWLLIGGFLLAALLSGKIIYSKAKKYGQEYQRMSK